MFGHGVRKAIKLDLELQMAVRTVLCTNACQWSDHSSHRTLDQPCNSSFYLWCVYVCVPIVMTKKIGRNELFGGRTQSPKPTLYCKTSVKRAVCCFKLIKPG